MTFHPDTVASMSSFRRLAPEGTSGALPQAAPMYRGAFPAGPDVDDAPPFEEWVRSVHEALCDLALTSPARVWRAVGGR